MSLEARVREVLQTIRFPGLSRDIVSFGFVQGVVVDGSSVQIQLRVPTHNPGAGQEIRRRVEEAVAALDGVQGVSVAVEVARPPRQAAQTSRAPGPELLPEVDHVVAVASGKGGVGKSTVAANLAVALHQLGYSVGLVDADIYGPSVPMMFGIDEKPAVEGARIRPFEKYGVKLMSLGFIVDMDTPVIWRGPMVMKALEQLLSDVDWGRLDFLVVDLPPGTGDAQLTLTQRVPLSGAIIVSTPQDVALVDARKGLAMFQKVNVPVFGLVENMSTFVCPHCGKSTDIFKRDGAQRTAEELGCGFLGRIPLDPAIVEGGDAGVPVVVSQPQGPHAEAFREIARRVAEDAGSTRRPTLSIV